MHEKSKYLLPGCTLPKDEELRLFFAAVRQRHPAAALPDDFDVRWIGGDAASTANILEHIHNGDKTGSVTVPQALQHDGRPQTQIGDAIILINYDGTPAMLVRVTAIEIVRYGQIDERHTALDGPRVRAVDIWKPVHFNYFNQLLAPAGLSCTDDTPISFETFEVICTADELPDE